MFSNLQPITTVQFYSIWYARSHNCAEKDRSRHSVTLYGKGDGGGGPLPEQIARLTRMHDVAGLPRVTMQSPKAAFEALRAEVRLPPAYMNVVGFIGCKLSWIFFFS